jgi:hypothetical protein
LVATITGYHSNGVAKWHNHKIRQAKWSDSMAHKLGVELATEIIFPPSSRTGENGSNTNFSLRLHYSEEVGKEGDAEAISSEAA